MRDFKQYLRGTHKVAIAAALICLPVILISGLVTEYFQTQAVGRLHYKYAPQKETPWVDIAADSATLQAWRNIFLLGPGKGPQTVADIAQAYKSLFSTGKLTRVLPDTQVRVTQRTGEADCYVLIFSGDSAGKSGWVDCRLIYH